jgi:putative peptidoglycan lipid II flippase
VLGAFLAWAAQAVDWIGLREHPWRRVGLLAGCLVTAIGLYFACLLATGLKLRQFIRRG